MALTTAEVVDLLEKAARKGNVPAMRLLLERPWERRGDDVPEGDPFERLDADVIPIRGRGA